MLNHVVEMGRLVRDPELRHTGSGTAVASFSIAVDRDYKNQNGERECDFFDCVAWRSTAEFVSRYFSKGRMAVVSGRLQKRSYEANDGSKRYVTEIVAENVYFGDSKKDGSSETSYGSAPATTYDAPPDDNYQPGQFSDLTDGPSDDELPF